MRPTDPLTVWPDDDIPTHPRTAALRRLRAGKGHDAVVTNEQRRLDFDAKVCMCGHVYGRHPWYDNPRGPRSHGWCLDCSCIRRRDKEVHEAAARRRAVAADPNHVHGSTHIAYACPGFIPMRICDECDQRLGA